VLVHLEPAASHEHSWLTSDERYKASTAWVQVPLTAGSLKHGSAPPLWQHPAAHAHPWAPAAVTSPLSLAQVYRTNLAGRGLEQRSDHLPGREPCDGQRPRPRHVGHERLGMLGSRYATRPTASTCKPAAQERPRPLLRTAAYLSFLSCHGRRASIREAPAARPSKPTESGLGPEIRSLVRGHESCRSRHKRRFRDEGVVPHATVGALPSSCLSA